MDLTRATVLAFPALLAGVASAFGQTQGAWTATGTMLAAREVNAQVLLSNGKVLAVGGDDGTGTALATAELYTPAKQSWAATGSLAAGREAFAAVRLANGKVLVAGGVTTGGGVLASAELFNPTKNTWSPAGSLAVARYAHTATLLADGKVLVTGGCSASGCSTTTAVSELYNPTTNKWSATGSLNAARAYHAAVPLNSGAVLAIGGYINGAAQSTELYDPTAGTWSTGPSTNQPRYQSATAKLLDGKVLVTGGVITKYPLSSAEIYDPVANNWTLTGGMTAGRYGHTATLLPDGTVVLSGGESQAISCGKDCTGFIPTASAEIFNESTGAFTATGGLPRALAYHTATLLAGGQALEGGGLGYTATCCVVVNNAAIYTPLTLSFSAASLNFGFLQTGLASPAQVVTVTNVSAHSASFTGITSAGDYSQTNTCPATLTPGQNCTIAIVFAPTVAGTRAGAITLADNDPGSPKQTITLTGTGEGLALGFSPSPLNLGSVAVGSASALDVTLINDGAAPVSLSGVAIAPANGTFSQTNNCPASLAVQQSCVFQVVFTPPDVSKYAATISVTNTAGAPATLKLSGTGLDGGGGG
jgi:N-acetylneuraminic acid mutarotase